MLTFDAACSARTEWSTWLAGIRSCSWSRRLSFFVSSLLAHPFRRARRTIHCDLATVFYTGNSSRSVPYLEQCTGAATGGAPMAQPRLDVAALYRTLDSERQQRKLSWRQVAHAAGVA